MWKQMPYAKQHLYSLKNYDDDHDDYDNENDD